MGLQLWEFKPKPHVTHIASGASVPIRVVADWDPRRDGGCAEVEFSCVPDSYTVSPSRVDMTVPADVESSGVIIKLTVTGPPGFVELRARSDTQRSFFLKIIEAPA